MSSPLKNIAITGASGSLGSVVLQKLISSETFNIRVVRRTGSSATFPSNIEVVDADFNDPSSLETALAGQDAVINAIAVYGDTRPHLAIAKAAVAAGVKRFIPSEYGANLDVAATRAIPIFAGKIEVQDYLKDAVSTHQEFSYTLVFNAGFLDWGLANDFLLPGLTQAKPLIINGGDLEFSTTTLTSVADAVVGILEHPEETKNRSVKVHDMVITQNRLLELAKRVAPGKEWQPVAGDLDEMLKAAGVKLAQGIYDVESTFPMLAKATFDNSCGCRYTDTDNELLGVKGKTEEDVVELLKKVLLE
ncbi:hypothetical protein B0H66DRAFT_371990 [Apodospora peruviana]|uniref:NmrA-like domain-containing protein n=1 Tax=Apodospora peruviana TaxID=516989 RepID=A0AAE0HX05_9PEZI|nr:hypothetical protein B0H66DRAFT_371990 [Apodospora peruviana]